ncbi:type VII toxin-antitoxin system MntA family adenylyltransferase antitoxin [Zhaonella formicivorans]|uniref:type VII toxin-antitoxin system MntA family adenylyltransferase antitoxin n=1 Tax=Zhaonella formicivorans TaxID=2528593 RepID=UPI0010DBD028|nr:nucleotidyltransferase domain-containing protein [Zhaonella formicivorans]
MAKRYSLSEKEKELILDVIKGMLLQHPQISFVYLHGSFLLEECFADIDLAVYLNSLKNVDKAKVTEYEIRLEMELEKAINYPVDLRVLNFAPLSFKYGVIKKGTLLFETDEEHRASFQERTLDLYFDFEPYRKRYFKEALGFEI